EGVRLGLASRSGDDLGIAGAVAQPCDVRAAGQVEEIVSATVEAFGRLDILISNAGVGAYGPFLELAPDFLEEMIDVTVKGAVYGCAPPCRTCSRAARRTSSHSRPRRGGEAFPWRPSTARRSSPRSASRARSTTSCANTASGARTSARAAWPPTSRSSRDEGGRRARSPE